MKKIVVLALAVVLAFNTAGCGKKEEAPKTEEVVEVAEEAVEEAAGEAISEEAEAEADGTSSDMTAMDAYIALSQSTFDELSKSLEGMMEFKASGEGNTLKYEMKVLVDMGDAETAKEQFDLQIKEQTRDMQMVVEGLKAAGVEDPKFIVEYTDKDDNVIATYNFE